VKAEVETAKARLVGLLGSAAKMEGGGVPLVRSGRADNVDYVAAVKDLVPGKSDDEIKEFFERYRKEGGETLTVRIDKPRSRKEKPKQELV
jgi:hypothetical protein